MPVTRVMPDGHLGGVEASGPAASRTGRSVPGRRAERAAAFPRECSAPGQRGLARVPTGGATAAAPAYESYLQVVEESAEPGPAWVSAPACTPWHDFGLAPTARGAEEEWLPGMLGAKCSRLCLSEANPGSDPGRDADPGCARRRRLRDQRPKAWTKNRREPPPPPLHPPPTPTTPPTPPPPHHSPHNTPPTHPPNPSSPPPQPNNPNTPPPPPLGDFYNVMAATSDDGRSGLNLIPDPARHARMTAEPAR